MSRRLKIVAVALVMAGSSAFANAQESYPSRPIKILVPFSPGSVVDTIARLYADKLTARMGQAVVVENKAGAGGLVSSQAMLALPANGYTFQMVSSSHAINPTLYAARIPYDTRKEMSCVAMVANSPTVITVKPTLNVRTVGEFVTLVKQKPGTMNYGSGGVGTAAHLAGEYFKSKTQTDLLHIPFKGVQEAVAEILGGRIDLAFPPVSIALPQIRAGKVAGLAITGAQRSPMLPEVPTAEEAGLKGFEYGIWYALVASSKTPQSVMERVAREVGVITASPDVREKLLAQGIQPTDVQLQACDRFVEGQIQELGALVKASGAKAD